MHEDDFHSLPPGCGTMIEGPAAPSGPVGMSPSGPETTGLLATAVATAGCNTGAVGCKVSNMVCVGRVKVGCVSVIVKVGCVMVGTVPVGRVRVGISTTAGMAH